MKQISSLMFSRTIEDKMDRETDLWTKFYNEQESVDKHLPFDWAMLIRFQIQNETTR